MNSTSISKHGVIPKADRSTENKLEQPFGKTR